MNNQLHCEAAQNNLATWSGVSRNFYVCVALKKSMKSTGYRLTYITEMGSSSTLMPFFVCVCV